MYKTILHTFTVVSMAVLSVLAVAIVMAIFILFVSFFSDATFKQLIHAWGTTVFFVFGSMIAFAVMTISKYDK